MINSMIWHVSLAMLPSSTIPSSNNTKKNLLGWQAEMDVDAGPQSPLYLLTYAECGMWLLSLQAGPLAASGAHCWYMILYVMLCLIRQRDASKVNTDTAMHASLLRSTSLHQWQAPSTSQVSQLQTINCSKLPAGMMQAARIR